MGEPHPDAIAILGGTGDQGLGLGLRFAKAGAPAVSGAPVEGRPLAAAVGDGAMGTVGIWQGSCAEMVASRVPKGVEVGSAFQNDSAHRLQHLTDPVDW